MTVLKIDNALKVYGDYIAVNNISFEVKKGEIFGLLGPNGAGKTSLIRMITGITGLDQGTIEINGLAAGQQSQPLIGYLPEERGLYKKMRIGEQLMYLSQLKGLGQTEAKLNILKWMDKFEIRSWWDKKVEELSKGMQQKVQFISTVMHDPELLILDEPFSGLDPVNTNLIRDEIFEQKKAGKSIIFSTHRMEQVEQICDRIALINRGEKILEGDIDQVKLDFKEDVYRFVFDGEVPMVLDSWTFQVLEETDNSLTVKLNEGTDANELLKAFIEEGFPIRQFEEILPSLNSIFIKKISQLNHA